MLPMGRYTRYPVPVHVGTVFEKEHFVTQVLDFDVIGIRPLGHVV